MTVSRIYSVSPLLSVTKFAMIGKVATTLQNVKFQNRVMGLAQEIVFISINFNKNATCLEVKMCIIYPKWK